MSLGFASGAMLYVVFGEIMPESYLIYRSKLPAFAVMVGLGPRHVHDLLLESRANLADARMIEKFNVGKPDLPGLRVMRRGIADPVVLFVIPIDRQNDPTRF